MLKADVHGSAEALRQALTNLSTPKVSVNVISAGVGGITESDVNLAKAGGAVIVGFHVRPAGKSAKHAEQEGVEIRIYDIIYDALDEVKAAMAGLLAPIKREQMSGKLAKINEELRGQRATGSAGAGLVTVEVNGVGEVLACRIDASTFAAGDRELVEDLLPAAINDALAKSKRMHAEAMKSIAAGLELPGIDSALAQLSGGEPEQSTS